MDRRALIHLVAGSVAASSLTSTVVTTKPDDETVPENKTTLEKGSVLLFQGDSITDARRDKKKFYKRANNSSALGDGYPLLIAGQILRDNPTKDLRIFNRGVAGHKVPDLQKRWKKDCIDMKPAVLSILVGVNDLMHRFIGRYDGSVEDYRTGFTELIALTKKELPEVRLVICEPFALRCGNVDDTWFPEFDERRQVAAEVAKAAEAIWVPFQSMFDTAVAAGTEAKFWAADGVHPTIAGHTLMAETWRKCVGV